MNTRGALLFTGSMLLATKGSAQSGLELMDVDIMFVGAHPDDDTGILAPFARYLLDEASTNVVRYTVRVKRSLLTSIVFGLATGCGGGRSLPTGPTPVTATVEFRYVVAEAGVASTSPALPCAGQVSLHPSWWGFSQVTMPPLGLDTWALVFEEVPVGRHSVKIRAPEGCGAYELSANGVPVEDGFDFTVHADGSVTP